MSWCHGTRKDAVDWRPSHWLSGVKNDLKLACLGRLPDTLFTEAWAVQNQDLPSS